MTDCRFAEHVHSYAEGRLAGADLVEFEAHLADCGACREQLAQLRKLDALLTDALRESEEIDVSGRVVSAISKPRFLRHRVAEIALIAASVLVALWVFIPLRSQDPSTRALADGAAWLMQTQESDGRWDSKAHGSGFDFDIGVTGLSVLALVEAHDRTGNAEALASASRGANWLISQQDKLGRFLRSHDQSRMYGQAVATLAILRVYENRPDARMRSSIENALAFGVRAQSDAGGWSYVPGITSDTSHTGWFVLALSRARSDGFRVPDDVLASAVDYVNGMTDAAGRVSYDVVGRTSPGLAGTSIAVNAAVAEPVQPEPAVYRVVENVVSKAPDWNDSQQSLYLWFFASRGFKSSAPSGPVRNWQRALAETLLAHQDRAQGADFGSWSNHDDSQADAGRVYATSLALITLAQTK